MGKNNFHGGGLHDHPTSIQWGGADRDIYLGDTEWYKHGAVPEGIKQDMLQEMLDYYEDKSMQHMLVPEQYPDFEKVSPGVDLPKDWEAVNKTRYVPAEGAVDMGHMGPDYTTINNIQKAMNDPDFDIGFMTEDYMKNRNSGAYYLGSNMQDIALNPYHMLDFSDPNVGKAFSQAAGKPRTYEDLKNASLKIGAPTPGTLTNDEIIAHELGHYGTWYDRNYGDKYKMEYPETMNINMAPGIPDEKIMDIEGHNEAYFLGRRHNPFSYNSNLNMNLNRKAADNIRNWTNYSRGEIEQRTNTGTRNVRDQHVEDWSDKGVGHNWGMFRSGTPTFAPSHNIPSQPSPHRNFTPSNTVAPRQPRPHNFNTGGIVSLVI
jgi:hypothetical protein|tara:strand:- start:113 stop:1234 length:1122 start_codon:yes stop_codon:yes gene_type:complete